MKPYLPEENVAKRLLQRTKSTPPVDIDAIASNLATIEYADLPNEADALLLYDHGDDGKPLIILDQNQLSSRLRFTLAHELGHIAIPWHVGSLVYHEELSIENIAAFLEYEEIEREANRFAAELLAPRDWVAGLFDEHQGDVKKILLSLTDSGMSIEASHYCMIRAAPIGNCLIKCRKLDDTVVTSTQTGRTFLSLPRDREVFDAKKYFNKLDFSVHISKQSSFVFYWIKMLSVSFSKSAPEECSKELIMEIMNDEGLAEDQIDKYSKSINGIVGSINGRMKGEDTQHLYDGMRRRFLADEKLKFLVKHPRFMDFIAARVHELRS